MFELIKSGGLMLILIFLCGVAATFIVFKRFFFFKNMKQRDNVLFETLHSFVDRREFDHAIKLCLDAATPTSALIGKALEFRNYPDTDIREAVENEANRQVPVLEQYLASLSTISTVSTLLGLLGTVIGYIKAFGLLGSAAAIPHPSMLSQSVSMALVTTAAGLIVSIPTIIAYNFFVSKVNKTMTFMESSVADLMIRLSGRDKLR